MAASVPARPHFAALALVATVVVACGGGDDEGGNPPGNLLQNSGLESGTEPWITLADDAGFEVTQDQALAGISSAVLRMNDPAEATGSKVYYLVQELTPEEFPEVLRGAYRVENWQRGAAKQYIQAVVIAIGPDNNPVPAENYQMRYVLSGVGTEPLEIGNAKYVFLSGDDPKIGEWIPFEFNVRDDFNQHWGAVPEGYEMLRLLFEVRYDDKPTGAPSTADVYYDELYLGSP